MHNSRSNLKATASVEEHHTNTNAPPIHAYLLTLSAVSLMPACLPAYMRFVVRLHWKATTFQSPYISEQRIKRNEENENGDDEIREWDKFEERTDQKRQQHLILKQRLIAHTHTHTPVCVLALCRSVNGIRNCTISMDWTVSNSSQRETERAKDIIVFNKVKRSAS